MHIKTLIQYHHAIKLFGKLKFQNGVFLRFLRLSEILDLFRINKVKIFEFFLTSKNTFMIEPKKNKKSIIS